jgi:ABC-2 type transport system permease protein
VDQPLLVIATVILGTVALGSWGFALAGLLRAEATLAVANGIFLLLLFAGGTVLPTDRLPGPLGAVVQLLPSAALGDALRAQLGAPISGSGLGVGPMLVLAVWAVAGIALSIRTFRWE